MALKAGDADDGLPFRRRFCGHSLSRLEWALNQCLNSRALTAFCDGALSILVLLTKVPFGVDSLVSDDRKVIMASHVDEHVAEALVLWPLLAVELSVY